MHTILLSITMHGSGGYVGRGLLLAVGLLLAPLVIHAQIVTDGTLGPRATLSGPTLTIGAELGQTRGGNLFHSFQDFNIQVGETATFTGPSQIANVIGRVTGGNASSIDGTLRSTVGQADVYLVNPFGVVLGPNARVDVPASLHVSTADELRFADGARFSAREPSASTLTVAAPESFGFLAPQPAGLTIAGSQLAVRAGKTLSLTAGDVTIAGTAEQRALAWAPGGTVRVEAVGAGGGAVSVTTPSARAGNGRFSMENADLVSNGDGGGRIVARAGEATLVESRLIAENQGAIDADGGIDLVIAGRLDLDASGVWNDTSAPGTSGMMTIRAGELRMDHGASMTSDSYRAAGDAGAVPIGDAAGVRIQVGGALAILDGSQIRSLALAEGNAGAVMIEVADTLELLDGAWIFSSTQSLGDAGAVTARAGNARLDGGGRPGQRTGISSDAHSGSSGAAGDVTLEIAGLLEVLDGAAISSSTWAVGDAGTVTARAGGARLDGLPDEFTGIASQANSGSSGAAGDVVLEIAGLLEVLDGAQVSTSTFAVGDAGAVTARAGNARLDNGGRLGQFTGIASDAAPGSSGAAGDVTLEIAGLLEVLDGAQIGGGTFAIGDAGTLTVRAGSARLDNGGRTDQWTMIASQANPGSSGAAGDVTLEIAGLLEVLDGAQISSSTFAVGDAGAVTARAGGARLDGGGRPSQFTGIASQANAGSSGAAGDVTLESATLLDILNGAQISSSTFAAGNAGTVTVLADHIQVDGGDTVGQMTRIASRAGFGATGAVGDIQIAANRLDLRQGGMISIAADQLAPAAANAPGAIIQIDAEEMHLETGGRITTASTATDAGAIRIAGGWLWLQDSQITTSANGATGDGGDIVLDSRQIILDGGFVQANTAAPGARGGDIRVDSAVLIASQGQVDIGGQARQTFGAGGGRNIIQAAAPGGESGTIAVTAPAFDISASVTPLAAPLADPDDLLADACRAAVGARPSRLVEGTAGFPADAAGVSLTGARLRRLRAD